VGLPGIVLDAISISLSAMMYWAFTVQGNGARLSPVRLIQMLNGGAGTQVLAVVFSTSRSSENTHHTFDRQVVVS
jgi:hypothetical protein